MDGTERYGVANTAGSWQDQSSTQISWWLRAVAFSGLHVLGPVLELCLVEDCCSSLVLFAKLLSE